MPTAVNLKQQHQQLDTGPHVKSSKHQLGHLHFSPPTLEINVDSRHNFPPLP